MSDAPNWNSRYSQPGFAYGEAPNDFLASVADRLRVGSALCLAEGEGRNAVFLAQRGFTVTAMDLSSVGMAKAATLAAQRGVPLQTVVANLADYRVEENAWDAVVAIWAHLPQPLRRQVHAAVVRGLKPGGAFVLEAYRPEQLEFRTGGPPNRDLLMSLADLREELAGLRLEIGQECVRTVQEGQLHNGQSAVVQVLGIKPA